jgi:phosphoglycerate dehydrogenase-like enzyme
LTVQILVTEEAYERWWPAVAAAAPEAEANVLRPDGSWSAGGVEEARVAWATLDLFRGDLTRRFFGGVTHAPKLQWLQSAAAGTDRPVFRQLVDAGVRVSSAHVNAAPIAEHVLWLALDHLLEGPRLRRAQQDHRWDAHDGPEVAGTTWTIVGMGSIGCETAVRARAFGVRVRGVRRNPRGDEPVDAMFPPTELPAALDGADVVVLAVPLEDDTRDMADERFFAAMAPGSLFVNVGRGGLVDEGALLRALDAGRPGRAALDVFVTEPLSEDSPFWDHDRVVVTPHVAGSAVGNPDRLAVLFCANLRAFLAGERLDGEIV